MRSATPTVQLHRPPMTSPYNPRAAQEVCPLPHSDSVHWSPGNNQWPLRGYQPSPNNQSDRSVSSSLTTMHSAVAPCQVKFVVFVIDIELVVFYCSSPVPSLKTMVRVLCAVSQLFFMSVREICLYCSLLLHVNRIVVIFGSTGNLLEMLSVSC